MPELPEVETVKRILKPQLTGRSVTGLLLNRPEIVEHPAPKAFAAAVTGAAITGMERRGKYLSILLDSGARIVLHLRMTGCLLLTPDGYPEEKHTHIVFQLDDANELRFIDPRRFGRFWLFHDGESDTLSGMHRLGPEPFGGELTAAWLSDSLSQRKRAVKSCLLDQEIIASIGNIYADEILFTSKIRPDRAAATLTPGDWERLAAAIPFVLSRAVEANDMTPREYLSGQGREYRNTPGFQVYGHAGQPCPLCGEALCSAVVAGRRSVFCSGCQKSAS